MFNVNVTVTASPELLDVLRKLTGSRDTGSRDTGSPAAKPTMTSVPASPAAPAADAKLDATLTLEQVRALVTAKSQAGKMTEVKALLTAFGVARATELPADKYAAFYSELEKIKVA